MEDDNPADSWPLLMRDVCRQLRRRADLKVAQALAVAIDLSRGYAPAEVRLRHALTEREYTEAARWAREALDAMRAEDQAAA